ncbi:MAG: ribosome small subunit-dependent GTPase [Actinomycetota bacterium]
MRHRFDEDDIRVRPGRNKSRPRTRVRPDHADAEPGFVVAVDRGRFTVVVDEGLKTERSLYAVKARELGRKGVLVGDRVGLVGDTSGNTDTLARIVNIKERTSLLRRTADDTDPTERNIVANAEQLLIVQALANPTPRIRFIDRCVIAAKTANIDPVIILTKRDLADDADIRNIYADMGVRIFTTEIDGDVSDLAAALAGKVSAVIGHSGVGKSTLVNALVPAADRAVGHVNEVTGRGRHTSTSAIAIELPTGGWIVDTPGVRSFGLGHVKAESLIDFYPELIPGTVNCPRACSHDEAECGLPDFVVSAGISANRLDSYHRLLRSLVSAEEE